MENISIGIDIATALSVVFAAIAFIRNTTNSRESARKESQKDAVQRSVFMVVEKLGDELVNLNIETRRIADLVEEGGTTQNLNPYLDLIKNMVFLYQIKLEPLGIAYGEGNQFSTLGKEFEEAQFANIVRFNKLTNSDEDWDFYEVMNIPVETTKHYIAKLMLAGEEYINSL